jgi:cytochrome c oxidase cbb3-type subunit I
MATSLSSASPGARIDESVRIPVLVFSVSAALWLLVGTAVSFILSFKLHSPGFLAEWAALTFGRLRGLESAVMVYGWACNAAFAGGLWMMSRLAQVELRRPAALVIAGLFWNLAVAAGGFGILAGHGTGLAWLDLPAYVGPALFAAYLVIGSWIFVVHKARTSPHVYVSQWYLLAALLWFPWLFSLAQVMLFIDPARGTMQALVHAWFGGGMVSLWFVPVGTALLYFLLPKMLARPISNYYLSLYGFWTLAIFGGWAGATRLIGGPVPAWVVSVGVAAAIMLVVFVVVLVITLVPTILGAAPALRRDWAFRFLAVGLAALVVAEVATVVFSFRGVAAVVQFSLLRTAHTQLLLYGFFSMVAFGAFYYFVPRVAGGAALLPGLAGFHFWSSVVGLITGVGALAIGGYEQGLALNTLAAGAEGGPTPFLDIVRALAPYLFSQTLANVAFVGAHVAFLINVLSLVWSACVPASTRETPSLPAEAATR